MLIQDYLDICDPVLTFDRFMGGIELEKYLKNIPHHYTGRLRYDPVSMLKTVLFGFMTHGYISLRELEDQCNLYKYHNKQKKSCNCRIGFHNSILMGLGELYTFL